MSLRRAKAHISRQRCLVALKYRGRSCAFCLNGIDGARYDNTLELTVLIYILVSLPKKAGQMVPATFCVHSSSTNEIDVWYTRGQNVWHGCHVYEVK